MADTNINILKYIKENTTTINDIEYIRKATALAAINKVLSQLKKDISNLRIDSISSILDDDDNDGESISTTDSIIGAFEYNDGIRNAAKEIDKKMLQYKSE